MSAELSGLDVWQQKIVNWQKENFPTCQDWELALGVCEEAGELADCVLKIHRKLRLNEYTEQRLQDAIGDIIVYLFGLCHSKGWKLSDVIETTGEDVLKRSWRA